MSEAVILKETRAGYAVTLDERQLGQAPFIIERDGKPVAAVVPLGEYRQFVAWRERSCASPATRADEGMSQDEALVALEKEHLAFLRLREQLLDTHQGKFVAILDGKVVDVDEDDRVLARRVYAQYGYIPIYIDQVVEELPVRRIPSPKKVVA